MSIARKILMGAAGAGSKSTYVDDVFSTYLYEGNETSRSINNGVDNTKGGMVWVKNRDNSAFPPYVYDTERGINKQLRTSSHASATSSSNTLTAFNDNGFSIGSDTMINRNNDNHVAWNFRKQKGFFDVVKYDGNATSSSSPARQIAHNLGSVPGCIMIKCITQNQSWAVYHRGIGNTNYLSLNDTSAATASSAYWGDTDPTSTHFTVKHDGQVNENGHEYVAYIFAGGESTAATARSVVCDGSGDYLSLGSSSDLAMGTGDFTIEGWYEINAKQNFGFFMNGPSGLSSTYGITVWNYTSSSYGLQFFASGAYQATGFTPPANTWFHLALVRNSGTTSLYYNGELLKAAADTTNYTNTTFQIGGYDSSPYLMNGSVSNFRIVKGTAVYTSPFRVPTEPLTAIPNTVLLCCNDSSTTGSTVTPGTITANGDPTASTNSPFDDPEGFQFGEEGDQNIIKCGKYNAPGGTWDLHLGWEPQWILIKNSMLSTQNWTLVDCVRGMVWDDVSQSTGYDKQLHPNTTDTENGRNICDAIPNGVRISSVEDIVNGLTQNYIYMAIRRPDGYVGKPAEAGTDVFTMAYGLGGSGWNFTAGFPVDFVFLKLYNSNGGWITSARLIQGKALALNNIDAAGNVSTTFFDSNTQVIKAGFYGSIYESFMFKRHGGFDVVTYKGDGSSFRTFNHSLGRTPEMMWVRGVGPNVANWYVYHKDLDNANRRDLKLENIDGQSSESTGRWNDTFPTATHFTVGVNANNNGDNYFAMLFSSVDGISKVGRYDGSNSPITITTGFQPRFLFVKRYDSNSNWTVFDTLRGWASGGDCKFEFNTPGPQNCNTDFGYPTSTGFYLTNDGDTNMSGYKFIYYAHA